MVEEIRAQQVNRARPVTGKGFALGVASVVLRLALAHALLFTQLLAHLGNQVFTQGVIGGAEGLPPVGNGFVHLAH